MIGYRSWPTIIRAILERQHYVALMNMVRYYPDFWDNFIRYLAGSGNYPYDIDIRTPAGTIAPRLYSYHDLLTVNEVFCRHDYFADESLNVVVDLGSNIGITALYFLTRNSVARCYLFEPDTRNIEKLAQNLTNFSGRYFLFEKAVSYEEGRMQFSIESSGRYGSLINPSGQLVTVDCLSINQVLSEILAKEESIDILKIDTEGVEIKTVEAIDHTLIKKIKKIYIEAKPDRVLYPDLFSQVQYGSVCRLTNQLFT